MRYLKYFESNDFYSSIGRNSTEEDFLRCMKASCNRIPFTESEIKEIEDVFIEYSSQFYINPLPNFIQLIRYPGADPDAALHFASIIKSEDEWYYVHIDQHPREYYKCDQIEGVIKCLQDEILKKV